jgi:hypothetical protein
VNDTFDSSAKNFRGLSAMAPERKLATIIVSNLPSSLQGRQILPVHLNESGFRFSA